MPINFQCSAVPFLPLEGHLCFFINVPYNPQFSTRSFPNSHQIFLGPCTRPQYTLPPISYILWPLGANFIFFSAVHSTVQSFQLIFFKFTPNFHYTRIQTPDSFLLPIIFICGHQEVNFEFYCLHFMEQSFQPIFFKFTPNIHHTRIQTQNIFFHLLVTFVTTRGPTLFFLCVLYTLQFSINLFQIHTKCSLGHGLDPSTLSLPTSDICGHLGANFTFYCVHSKEQNFQPIFFKFTPNVHWAMLQPPVHCLHLFGICGHQGG